MKNFLDKLITKVNLQSPDMVVIVGDLIDTNPKDLKITSQNLMILTPLTELFMLWEIMSIIMVSMKFWICLENILI